MCSLGQAFMYRQSGILFLFFLFQRRRVLQFSIRQNTIYVIRINLFMQLDKWLSFEGWIFQFVMCAQTPK